MHTFADFSTRGEHGGLLVRPGHNTLGIGKTDKHVLWSLTYYIAVFERDGVVDLVQCWGDLTDERSTFDVYTPTEERGWLLVEVYGVEG